MYPDRERGDGGIIVQPQKGLEQQLRNLDVKVYSSLPGFVDQASQFSPTHPPTHPLPLSAPRAPALSLEYQVIWLVSPLAAALPQCALLVDCVWGLGFKGVPGAPWDVMFKQLNDPAQFGSVPLVSVDLPSGWDADLGPPEQPVMGPDDEVPPPPITVMYPDVLVENSPPPCLCLSPPSFPPLSLSPSLSLSLSLAPFLHPPAIQHSHRSFTHTLAHMPLFPFSTLSLFHSG